MKNLLKNSLKKLEHLIWQKSESVDSTTATFYFFEPFPSGLDKAERHKWCELKKETKAPFPSAYCHSQLIETGLCMWFSKEPLHGLPETSCCNALEDGVHFVKSSEYLYKQTWKGSVLINCASFSNSENYFGDIEHKALRLEQSWCTHRDIKELLDKPKTYFVLMSIVFLSVFAYHFFLVTSVYIQAQFVENRNTKLNDEIGPILNAQDQANTKFRFVEHIQNWRNQKTVFAHSIGLVFTALKDTQDINILDIVWQTNTIELVFYSAEVDVSRVVEQLQEQIEFERVSIRPHSLAQTWVIEVGIK